MTDTARHQLDWRYGAVILLLGGIGGINLGSTTHVGYRGVAAAAALAAGNRAPDGLANDS